MRITSYSPNRFRHLTDTTYSVIVVGMVNSMTLQVLEGATNPSTRFGDLGLGCSILSLIPKSNPQR